MLSLNNPWQGAHECTFHRKWARAAECYHEQWTFSTLPALFSFTWSFYRPTLSHLSHTWAELLEYTLGNHLAIIQQNVKSKQLVPVGSQTTPTRSAPTISKNHESSKQNCNRSTILQSGNNDRLNPRILHVFAIDSQVFTGWSLLCSKWAATIGESLAQKPKAVQQFCSLGNRMKQTQNFKGQQKLTQSQRLGLT